MSTGHVFGGTRPYEEVRWDLVPGQTAIVVIDPQNDFLHDEGWYARQGIDIAHMRRCIEPIEALVAAARKKNVPVVWTRHGSRGLEDGGPFMRLRPFLRDGGLRQDTCRSSKPILRRGRVRDERPGRQCRSLDPAERLQRSHRPICTS